MVAECEGVASIFEGGTEAPVIQLQCLRELLESRAAFLERSYRPILAGN